MVIFGTDGERNSLLMYFINFVKQVVSTLYWLGCTVQGMSYYRGPRLNLSNFQRESDGTITVKVCTKMHRR